MMMSELRVMIVESIPHSSCSGLRLFARVGKPGLNLAARPLLPQNNLSADPAIRQRPFSADIVMLGWTAAGITCFRTGGPNA
jgi:hypothetical protein